MKLMIVIVGVAGAGKSSLGRLLRLRGYNVIELRDYVLSNDAYIAYDLPRDALVVPYNICPDKILISVFVPECDHVGCVLVDIDAETLRRRLKRRGYNEDKIKENIDALEAIRIEVEEFCDDYIIVDGRNVELALEDVIKFIEKFEKVSRRRIQ